MGQHDYHALSTLFEHYLRDHPPSGYPDSLYAPMRYINQMGGKRIRPVLLLMGYNMWSDDVTRALPAAMAVEFFHNFSLMHDDIMDEAPLRRGKETVHQYFGRNKAILSGDAMLIMCFHFLLEAGKEKHIADQLMKLMIATSLEICEGQQLDMDFEERDDIDKEEYLEMIRKKTACLLGLSLQIGAILAGASTADAELLYHFGQNMGMAFQIKDDFLDAFGDEKLTGKQSGGDILQGKKNFLYVLTANEIGADLQEDFKQTYAAVHSREGLDNVIMLFKKYHIPDLARETENRYFLEAFSFLDKIKSAKTEVLRSFANEIFRRDH